MSGSKVKLALVGCGYISAGHIRGYRNLFEHGCDAFEISACCDVSKDAAEACAAQIGELQGSKPAVFDSVEGLTAAGAAEAADVCVPHCFHHSVAIPLLEAGLHVLLEKPLGITMAAGRAIIAAAEKHGRILSTAENIRRGLSARAARWALSEEKMIGDVRHVDVQMISHGQFDYSKPLFKWRGVKLLTGGGMIMDSGAHFTDMMLYLFGEPDTVWAEVRTLEAIAIEDVPVVGRAAADVEDEWLAVLKFRCGTRVLWAYNRVQPGSSLNTGYYYGTRGTMECLGNKFHAFQDGGRIVLDGGAEHSREWIEEQYRASLSADRREALFPWGVTEGIAVEIGEFVRAVRTGAKVEMDGRAGQRAKALSIACYESSLAGEPASYADVLEGRIDAYQRPINEYWGIGVT